MGKRKFLMFVLCITLLLGWSVDAYADSDSFASKVENYTVNYLIHGYSEHYNISKCNSTVINCNQGESSICEYLFVTLFVSQIENDIMEAPYVRGLASGIGICDTTDISLSNISISDMEDIVNISNEEKEILAFEVENIVGELSQNIGVEVEFNFYLKVEADIINGIIDENSVVIYAENDTDYIPVEKLFPASREALYQQGVEDAEKLIRICESGMEGMSYASIASTTDIMQKRTNIAVYADAYSSNPTVCDCGRTDCSGMQNKAYWNNSMYPYYSALLHNDCADFVSQALYYAGLAEDSTWYADQYTTTRSTTWTYAPDLVPYMINRGVFSQISSSSIGVGDIIVFSNNSHVGIISFRDSNNVVTMTAHTHDRKNINVPLNNTFYRVTF